MLGAALRYLQTHVGRIHSLLTDTVHLMSGHDRIALARLRAEILERNAPLHLLEHTQPVAIPPKILQKLRIRD